MKSFLVIVVIFASICSTLQQTNILDTSGIDFFHGDTFEDFNYYPLASSTDLLMHPKFNNTRMTLFYIYGHNEYKEYARVRRVISAYQQRGDHNILILDWAKINGGRYVLDAVPNTIRYGDILADAVVKLINNGLKRKNLHVVAHSLGCQLAGLLGRKIISKTNGKIRLRRITALDPAFPLFYPNIFTQHLNKNDAEMVDVIHTDGWIYGAPVSTGTIDFWPNSGVQFHQPGCPQRSFRINHDSDLCAHWRSVDFYIESVIRKNETIFQSMKCNSWRNFVEGQCDNNDKIVSMGIDCPNDVKGDYYLQTNEVRPFSRGIDGMKYKR